MSNKANDQRKLESKCSTNAYYDNDDLSNQQWITSDGKKVSDIFI